MANNTLMFSVGIEDIQKELNKHKAEIDSWVNSNPIKLKVQWEESSLKALSEKLKAMGAVFGEGNADVKKLEEQLAAVQARYDAIVKQIQQATSAVKTTGDVSKQVAQEQTDETRKTQIAEENRLRLLKQVEDQIKRISNISSQADKLGIDKSAIEGALDPFRRLLQEVSNKDTFDAGVSTATLKRLKQEYKDLITEADKFNKTQEKASSKMQSQALKDAANAAKEAEKENQKWAESMDLAKTKANSLKIEIEKLEAIEKVAKNFGIDTTSFSEQIERLKQNLSTLYGMMGGSKMNGTTKDFVNSSDFKVPLDTVKALGEALKKGVSDEKAYQDAVDKVTANIVKSYIEREKAAERASNKQKQAATTTANNLDKQIESLNAKKINFKGMDMTELDAAINRIRAIKTELENFARTGTSTYGNNAREIVKTMGLAEANEQARIALQHLNTEKRNSINATNQLSESEQRLANAIKGSSDSMMGQINILSDLKTMAMQYLGVWGGQQFVHKIIETGGLLEQQRLSIGAILGSMDKAEVVFGKIKDLAIKSPFGVVELDRMSKQLTAYNFQYEELFDWTKRLADISAATGTEVSRLALALGHVRAEGALSGYTLRQFAMANVPLLQNLANNLGITTKQVREKTRKKEISYEDVKKVLEDLTGEGGMFYNAQEVMSQALNAKFKNLRDAFDIMYGEMAESNIGDVLKRIAEALTAGAKEWKRFGTDILWVASTFGVIKAATIAYNTTLGKTTASTLKSALAAKRQEIANLELTASYRRLTIDELRTMATAGKLNSTNLATLISTQKLTYAELERAVALGKVDKASALVALRTLQMHKQYNMLRNIAPLTGWARTWALIGFNIQKAGLAVKSFMASLWPLLAIGAAVDIFSRWSQQGDKAKQSAEEAAAAVMTGYSDIQAKYNSLRTKGPTNKASSVEDMKDLLQENGAYYTIKEQVEGTKDVNEQYDILYKKLQDISNAYVDMKYHVEAYLEAANNVGGGFWEGGLWSDNMLTDINQLGKATIDKNVAESRANQYGDFFKRQVKSVLEKEGKWAKEYETKTIEELSNNSMIWQTFINNAKNASDADKQQYTDAMRYIREYGIALKELQKKEEEVKGHMPEYSENIKLAIQEIARPIKELDFSKAASWEEDDIKLFYDSMTKVLNSYNVPQETKDKLRNMILDSFPKETKIKVNVLAFIDKFKKEDANDKIEPWIKDLQKYFEENKIKVQLGVEDDSIQKVEKKLQDARKAAQAKMNSAGAILTYWKIKPDLSAVEDFKKKHPLLASLIEKVFGEYTEGKEQVEAIDKAHTEKGFDVDDPKKKKKSSGGSKTDENARVLRERVRILKEAADSYQYWREKVGESGAESHMQEEFGQLLTEQNLQLKNADELKAKLKSLRDEYSKKPQTKAMVEAIKEIDKEIAKLDRKDFEKDTERFLSQTQIELDNLTRSWEMFNSVREATGNVKLAEQLSGANYANGKNRNLADALKEMVQKDFNEAGGVGMLDFNMNLSERQIKDLIEQGAPKAEDESVSDYEKRIKALVESYKKWRDLQRDVLKSDMNVFTKLVGSAKDYDSQIRLINDRLKTQIEANNNLVKEDKISKEEADKENARATAQAEDEKWKKSLQYTQLMNNSLNLTRQEVEDGINRAMDNLNRLMQNNLLTAQEYADEMMKIQKIQSDWNKNSFFGGQSRMGAYIKGGLSGIANMYRGKEAQATAYAEGFKASGNAAGYMMAKAQANGAGKNADKYESLGNLFNDFEALAKALDPVIDLFDKLGMSEVGQVLGIGQNALNSAASMGSGAAALFGPEAGYYGAAIGAGLSVVSSIFGMHDAALQEEIDELKANNAALEANTKAIKMARERTLGYDTGEIRRQYASMYGKNDIQFGLFGAMFTWMSAAQKALQDFYNTNINGNGYSQELANLKKERQNYMQMYNAEEDKKDSSSEALSEYKEKIAELDDQIRFFTQDLAKDLWDIDIQGWADQVSDAIWTAFENGEDAMKAFRDTAKSIVADVAERMMDLSVIEPIFQRLQQALFGTWNPDTLSYSGGAIKYDKNGNIDMQGSEQDVMKVLGMYFGEGGALESAIGAAESFYDMMKRATGIDFGSDSGKTTSKIIQGGFTENETGLVLSYLNGMRADVSVEREMVTQLMQDYIPSIKSSLTSATQSLSNIERNTNTMVRMMESYSEDIAGIYDILDDARSVQSRALYVRM